MKHGEMDQKQRINVATSLNSKYMRYTYVMLTSLFENRCVQEDIHIYLLQKDLTDYDKEKLKNLVESYGGKLHLIQIDNDLFPKSCPVSDGWSLETYFRLALLDVLPQDVDKLLYLDVDIIINKSLSELYNTDFEGNMVCACPDTMQWVFPDSRNKIFEKQIEKGFTYFNAGVMLLNIKELRGKYGLKDYLNIAEKLEYRLEAPDQDLLNYIHWNEIKFIDSNKFNLFALLAYNHGINYEDVKQEVMIVHYPGPKLWSGKTVHFNIEQLWWDYAKKIPFYSEFMEEFMEQILHDSTIYDTMQKLMNDKKMLKEELDKSVEICQKLVKMIGLEKNI